MFQAIHALDVHTSMYVVHHRFPLRIHNVLRWYTRLGDGYVWALVVAYLFWNYPFFAFPSGHTMNNLAAGLTIAILAPEIGWLVVFMPITWGVLRIYFGVHWLSDVIAEVWLHLLTNTFGIV